MYVAMYAILSPEESREWRDLVNWGRAMAGRNAKHEAPHA